MKIKIESIIDGKEIIEDFSTKIKSNGIDVPWKSGDSLPMGMKILITNKQGQDIEIMPDKLKIVFIKE